MPTPYLSRLKLEKELEKKAQALRKKKEQCDSIMGDIDGYMNILERKVPVDKYQEEYKKGKEFYDIKDMDAAIKVFESLRTELREKLKEVYIDEEKKIEKLMEMLSGDELTKIKVDLKEGKDNIENNPNKSFEILREIREKLEVVIEDNLHHLKRELTESIGKIDGFDWLQSEVNQVGEERGVDALLRLRKIRDKAISDLESKIQENMDKSELIVQIAKSAHFNLPFDTGAGEKIKELMSEGNYAGALRVSVENLESAKKSFEFFYNKLYDIAERIVEEGKLMDIDISEILPVLQESRKKYATGDFKSAVDLIRKSTEEIEKMKVQKVMDMMKNAREIFIEAKSQGINVNPFLKRMDNARNFLKIGKPKRAYDIVLETLDMVGRRKNLYAQLKSEISRIKESITDLKKENIVLEGVDETIIKIENEIEKDADNAEKMLNNLISSIKISLRDIAQTLYGDLSKILELADKEKIVLEDIKLAMADVKGQISDENYKDAILALRKIEEDLYTRIAENIKEMEKRTKKYNEDRINEAVTAARSAMEEGDLENAIKKIKEIRVIVFELESKEYLNKINEMKKKIDFLKRAGGNTTEVMSYIERAEIALKKKDIVRVEDYLTRGESTLKSVETMVAKDAFDSAKTIATSAKRIGVKISDQGIMTLLKRAKESIESGDYKSAISYSVEAKTKSKDLRDQAERAYSRLVNAAKRVAKIKEMGGKVDEIAKLLVNAKKSFEDNDFDRAENFAEKCINLSEKLEATAQIETLRKEIDAIGKVMIELGLRDVYKQKSKDFYRRYEDMKYENLSSIGEKVLAELREYVETILTDYIGKIETDLYDAKAKGYKISINMDDLENAKDLFIKRKYMDSLYILKKLENQIAAVYERNERMGEIKSTIKKYIDMGVSLGVNVNEYKHALSELSKMKDLKEAEKEAKKIINAIENALYKKVHTLIVKVEKELDAMRRRGEDVTAPDNIINKAKASLKEKKYVESLNKVMSAVGEIEKYEMQKNTAYGILKQLEVKIKTIKNLLPKRIIDEYEYSKKMFLKGLYEQSIERSMKVSEELSEIERILNYVKDKNKQIREMVMKTHHLGMDVKDVIRIFNQAKEAFKNMQYEESLKLVDQCYAEAKLLMIDAMNRYKGAYSRMLMLIKRLKIEDSFKDDIREMEMLFEEGDYDKIKLKLSEMKKALDQKLGDISKDMINDFIEKKDMFRELKVDAGIDLDAAEMKLREYRAKNFNKFFEYISVVNGELETRMPALMKTKVEALKEEFDKYEKYGVNMEEYHVKLYEILSVIEKKDYREIFAMLREVENNFRMYINEYVKTLIERVRKKVSEYSDEKASEYVDRMEKMRGVKNYIDAIRIYEEANNFVGRYKVFMEDFGKKAEGVKDRLRFALSLGLKVGDLISQLKEIEENAPVDMEKASLALDDLKSKVNMLIDSLEPKLDITVDVGDRTDGKIKAILHIENTGKVEAQNIRIHIRGALISDGAVELLKVDKDAKEDVETFVQIGRGRKVSILAEYNRFDGKEYTFNREVEINIQKERKGYHIEKAKGKLKCTLCRGTILPGMDIVICDNCGAVYHVPCAKRIKKCRACGQAFKFD